MQKQFIVWLAPLGTIIAAHLGVDNETAQLWVSAFAVLLSAGYLTATSKIESALASPEDSWIGRMIGEKAAKQIASLVNVLIPYAETLKEKSGPERRAFVISTIVNSLEKYGVKLPWWTRMIPGRQAIIEKVVTQAVDKGIGVLNGVAKGIWEQAVPQTELVRVRALSGGGFVLAEMPRE